MELAFENAVSAAGLLLLTQLHCVFADLLARAAMLAGGIRTTVICALVSEAAVALQKKLAAFATAHAALGFSIFGHLSLPLTVLARFTQCAN